MFLSFFFVGSGAAVILLFLNDVFFGRIKKFPILNQRALEKEGKGGGRLFLCYLCILKKFCTRVRWMEKEEGGE